MLKTYRGLAVPTHLANTYELYLWQSGVDAAAKHGFLRLRIGAIKDRLKRGELLDFEVTVHRRSLRIGVFFGRAPGSHMGLWRTDLRKGDIGGPAHGWNYRVGKLSRCLTILAHTKRADPDA